MQPEGEVSVDVPEVRSEAEEDDIDAMCPRPLYLTISSLAIVSMVVLLPPEYAIVDPQLGIILAHLVLLMACALDPYESFSIPSKLAYVLVNAVAMHGLCDDGMISFAWVLGFLVAFALREFYSRTLTLKSVDVAIVAVILVPLVGLNAVVCSAGMIEVTMVYQIATYATLALLKGQ